MSANKVRKTVSFNITNEKDREYLERIENVNFNSYVKKLIEKDIKSRKIVKRENKPIQQLESGHTVSGPIITRGTPLVLLSE